MLLDSDWIRGRKTASMAVMGKECARTESATALKDTLDFIVKKVRLKHFDGSPLFYINKVFPCVREC